MCPSEPRKLGPLDLDVRRQHEHQSVPSLVCFRFHSASRDSVRVCQCLGSRRPWLRCYVTRQDDTQQMVLRFHWNLCQHADAFRPGRPIMVGTKPQLSTEDRNMTTTPNHSRQPRPSSALRNGERSRLGLAAFNRSEYDSHQDSQAQRMS